MKKLILILLVIALLATPAAAKIKEADLAGKWYSPSKIVLDLFGGSGDPYILSTDPLYCLEAEEVKFNTKPQQINHTLNAGAWLLNLMISDSNNNYILGFGNFYPSSESLFTEIEYYGGGTRPLRRRRNIRRYLQNNLGDVVNIDWK